MFRKTNILALIFEKITCHGLPFKIFLKIEIPRTAPLGSFKTEMENSGRMCQIILKSLE